MFDQACDVYIYDALRTPRGRARQGGAQGGVQDGALHAITPLDLLSSLYLALEERVSLDPASIEDVVLGCATQVGEQAANIAKTSTLYHGWPDCVPGVTVNRYCSSGLDAISFAASKIACGLQQFSIAGGIEMMSRVAMLSDRPSAFTDAGLARKIGMHLIGVGADYIASKHGVSRAQADAIALHSQHRAAAARERGYFASLVPVVRDGKALLEQDETIRVGTSAESLAAMPAAFSFASEDGSAAALLQDSGIERLQHIHTAGNSPAMADGASLLLLGSEAAAGKLGCEPRARIAGMVTVNADHREVVSGCLAATAALLEKFGKSAADIDLFEIHEAFAATMVLAQRKLCIDAEKLNVNGGCIALGHPLGATGGIVVSTLLDEMERRELSTGIAATSGAAGAGTALLLQR